MNNFNITKSKAAFAAAKNVIPGGVNSPVRSFASVGGEPLFMSKGKGALVYDLDGNAYLDFVQSFGPLILGHDDSEVVSAIQTQATKGLSFGAPTLLETELAQAILASYPAMDKIRFVNSGTEAVMSAIRLARAYTNKKAVIKFEGCYHGHSDGLLVSAGSGLVTLGEPNSPGVLKDFTKHTLQLGFGDLAAVEAIFKKHQDIACIIIEPIAGNMGMIKANKSFLQGLRNLCDKHKSLLIFDEVMTGFRVAKGGATEIYGITPDIMTLGKVIGGGLPVGAFLACDDIMQQLSPLGAVYQAGTLSGNPLAMAAGLACVNKINSIDNFYEILDQRSSQFVKNFQFIAKKQGYNLQVVNQGAMFGFSFANDPIINFTAIKNAHHEQFKLFFQQALTQGLYFACSHYESAFLSWVMDDKVLENALEKIDAKCLQICLNFNPLLSLTV